MKATGISVKAENGDVIALSVNEKEGVFVFEEDDDDVTETQKICTFLMQVKDHFFGYNHKHTDELTSVAIYPCPGSRGSIKAWTTAFLNDLMYEPSEEFINKVIKLIEDESEKHE